VGGYKEQNARTKQNHAKGDGHDSGPSQSFLPRLLFELPDSVGGGGVYELRVDPSLKVFFEGHRRSDYLLLAVRAKPQNVMESTPERASQSAEEGGAKRVFRVTMCIQTAGLDYDKH
jgi:hypothetical protein